VRFFSRVKTALILDPSAMSVVYQGARPYSYRGAGIIEK
jgi:hypothetical protein